MNASRIFIRIARLRLHGYYGHMKAVNIAELKNRLSFYLNEVKSGHEVLVRDRNIPIARILPVTHESSDDELLLLAAEGKIRLGEGEIGDEFWDLPAPRVPTTAIRKAVAEERKRE
jgi:prevent-host-death family protein